MNQEFTEIEKYSRGSAEFTEFFFTMKVLNSIAPRHQFPFIFLVKIAFKSFIYNR